MDAVEIQARKFADRMGLHWGSMTEAKRERFRAAARELLRQQAEFDAAIAKIKVA